MLTGGDATADGADPPDRDRERPAPTDKVQCEEVFGPVVTLTRVDDPRRGDRRGRTRRATGSRRRSSAATCDVPPGGARARVRRRHRQRGARRSAPTRCPTAGSRPPGNTKEGPAWAVREMTEERLVVFAALAGSTPNRSLDCRHGRTLSPAGERRRRHRAAPAPGRCAAPRAPRAPEGARGRAPRPRRAAGRDVPARRVPRRPARRSRLRR